MAIIRIYHDEAERESFPSKCMRCGANSERLVPHTFTWMPSWVHVFIFAGLLPWLIVATMTRKTLRVAAPMCARHINHWRNRTLYIWVGLFCWVGLGILLALVAKDLPEDMVNPAVALCVFGSLIWLIVGVLLANGAIRAAAIGDFGVDLANVNREFAEAWRMHCEESDSQSRRRRQRRGPGRPTTHWTRPAPSREDPLK
jgi:hypothetical protein